MNIEHLEHTCPNHWADRKGQIPDMICMHITEGSTNSAISWFQNSSSQVSSHFIIGADGRIVQMVDLNKGAWCNGDRRNPTARLIKEREGLNPNTYTFSIEHEGFSEKDRKGALTEAQYQASLYACKEIIKFVKNVYGKDFIVDRDHIIGHYEINSIDKVNCPGLNKGQYFPFDRFINDLKTWQKEFLTPYPFIIGQIIYPKENVTLLETAGYGGNSYVLPKNTKCIVSKYHEINGRYMALKNENGEYFTCAWTKEFDKFTTVAPVIESPIEEEPIEEPTEDTENNEIKDKESEKTSILMKVINLLIKLFKMIFKKN